MAQQDGLQLTFDLVKTMFPRVAAESEILKDQDGSLARLVRETPNDRLFELKVNPKIFPNLIHHTYLVRLALDRGEDTLTPRGPFEDATEKQYLASEKCPEIVKQVITAGVNKNAGPEGKDINYMAMPYPNGAIPFSKELWEDLGPAEQGVLMDSIVNAMHKYRFLGLPDDTINPSTLSADWEWYLPHLGSEKKHVTMKDFLVGLIEAAPRPDENAVVRVVDTIAGGIEVVLEEASPFGLRHRVEFTAGELEEIHRYAVVCHNDIEPENIMVRQEADPVTGTKRYALAAIINWDKAGIYPFAYEFALRDFAFRPDQSHSWYRLFKSKTAAVLLPDELSTDKFIRAIWAILHAKGKSGRMSTELAERVGMTRAGKCLGARALLEMGERRGWFGV